METSLQTLFEILFTKESNLHSRTASLKVILLSDSSPNVATLKETFTKQEESFETSHLAAGIPSSARPQGHPELQC